MKLNHFRTGAGEPLVLLHGIGHRWQGWNPVLDRLGRERDVVALDLPGFASSPPPPPGTPPGAASAARLVGDFLDELGLDRPHVAGNSLGGWIALELAKADRVRSATVLSPAGFHSRAEAAYQYGFFWADVRIARLTASRAERLFSSPLGRKLAFGLLVARTDRIAPEEIGPTVRDIAHSHWFDAMNKAITSENFAGGEQIRVPVTIAWGEKDRVLLPRQAPRALRAIPGARAVTLHGCGHVPMSDDPEQVAQVLLEGSSGDRRA